MDYELLRQHARNLRSCPTEAERAMWNILKDNKLGLRFRRQHIILDYIVDFVCLKAKLIVEVDGPYHFMPEQIAADHLRTIHLESKGYKVLRYENHDVLNNPIRVSDMIFDELVNRIRQIQQE
ncbi:MAG: endonuclease domain-containing protein [Alloprevotella sp.]|nr:endonuclease domain-containing protein [Alloprevotella sp.]MBR6338789.1 endonuclease domain-containing protein [Alloprevotella sp.]